MCGAIGALHDSGHTLTSGKSTPMTWNAFYDSLQFFGLLMAELVVLFLGISLLVALAQEYVPDEKMRGWLTRGRRGTGNVVGAALGGLTPFCSCSTIPVTLGLLNAKAPFGAVMSFLIASPLINPVVLGLLWVILGWQATLAYGVVGFLLAVVGGMVWETLGLARDVKRLRIKSGGHASEARGTGAFRDKLGRSWQAAWGDLRGVFWYLVLGVAVGAGIYGFVPQDLVAGLAGPDNPLAIPVSAVIGIPLYVRAETMIPVGLALIEKGMGTGAVIALIIGGAGASIPEVSMLASIFRPRLLGAFVTTVLVVAVTAGFSFALLF